MKIILIGTVEFSKLSLQKLIDLEADLAGVVTRKASAFNSDFADLSILCAENKIPVHFTDDVNGKETVSWVRAISPDIIFCFGWSSLIKKELLSLPSKGVIGFHPAALPKNRGRHPLIWALVLGLKETASTFFFMTEGADTGDILSQEPVIINADDYAIDLYRNVSQTALEQIAAFLPQLSNNTYQRIKQDNLYANSWRKRNRLDGIIDFRMSSQAVYNLVRALSKPYVGASLIYQEQEIKIWRTKIETCEESNLEPGLVLDNSNGVLVKTYDSAIRIVEHGFATLPETGSYL